MRILLGMSGGLDSTYAALKLIEQGHTVEGAVLKMHAYTETGDACRAAESLGIPIHVIDCSEEFEKNVISDFLLQYPKGRTPNPCIVCNSTVKFRFLLEYARKNGFDRIATGHYSRVVTRLDRGELRYTLADCADSKKDQTYVLYRLSQDVLSNLILPLSDSEKSEIREIALAKGLFAAEKSESQEICFIPTGDYASYIEERVGKIPPGFFINNEGNVLGEHKGIIHYTVGQRKGLGIALGTRVFVTEIDPVANTVKLSEFDSFKDEIYVSDMNFLGMSEPDVGEQIELSVKIRYLAPKVACTLTYLGGGRAKVNICKPQRAVTPGQSAVFYVETAIAMGGYIE